MMQPDVASALLRVLIVEDREADAELIARALRGGPSPVETRWVRNAAEFEAALDDPPDAVLADFSMPDFGALSALESLRRRGLQIPFLVVSGTIGEEQAASLVLNGASDYVLKDNLTRLHLRLDDAVERKRLRDEAQRAHAELAASEARYRELVEQADDIVFTLDPDGVLTSVNNAGERFMGPVSGLAEPLNVLDVLLEEQRPEAAEIRNRMVAGLIGEAIFEAKVPAMNGDIVWFEVKAKPIRRGDRIVGIQGIARDVTERRQAEQEVRDSQVRMKALFDTTLDAIMLADDEGCYVDANPAAAELLGAKVEEIVGQTIWDFTPEVASDEGLRLWREFIEAGTQSGEYPLERRDGSVVCVEYRAVANILPGVHLSVMRDVTERKRSEAALREARDRMQTLIDASPLAIFTLDVDGVVQDWNAAAEGIFGWSSEEAVGRPLPIVPPDKAGEFRALLAKVVAGHGFTGMDVRRLRKDGAEIDVSLSAAPVTDDHGTTVGIIALAADITERLRIEREREALLRRERELSEELRLLLESTDEGIYGIDLEGRCTFLNRAAAETLGRCPEDVVGRCIHDLIHHTHPGGPSHPASACPILSEDHVHELDDMFWRADGTSFAVEYSAHPILDEGAKRGTVVTFTDVTERRLAENALRESEERFRQVMEHAADSMLIVDADLRIVHANVRACDMLGYELDELVGADIMKVSVASEAEIRGTWERLQQGDAVTMEGANRRKDGSIVPIEVGLSRMLIGGRSHLLAIARDVTERKAIEAKLRSSLKQLQEADTQRRRLLSRLVKAQEEERQRIASDIHDDSVQVMTAVGLRLRTLRNQLTAPAQIELAEYLEDTVGLSISRLRHLLFELRPRALDTDGLAAALRMYMEQQLVEAGVGYELHNRVGSEPRSETRVQLFRIAQEALSNVRKHARASNVTVAVLEYEGGFGLRVEDDGVGVSNSNGHGMPGHMGVAAMQDRAETAGGWFRIEDGPQGGTVVECWIPQGQGVLPE